jgi:hypothetical protein
MKNRILGCGCGENRNVTIGITLNLVGFVLLPAIYSCLPSRPRLAQSKDNVHAEVSHR